MEKARQAPDHYRMRFDELGWAVPTFDYVSLKEKNTRYALVIPVINEGERIRTQLEAIKERGFDTLIDVIIADGGSTDNSLEIDFLRHCGVRTLITKTGPGKLSAQLRCGYSVALCDGYHGIVTMDGNGKDSVAHIPKFVDALMGDVDYAQASRFIRGGRGENTPFLRHIAVRFIHSPVLSLAAGRWFTDTTQGFRAYSSRYLNDDRVAPFRNIFMAYELLAYLTVRATQLGYKTVEIPTVRRYPAKGATPTKITSWRAYQDLLKVLFSTLARRYHPSPANQENST
ncbi:MAG: glycosyltransferase family 2 protein [Pseudomonadota bacterium]